MYFSLNVIAVKSPVEYWLLVKYYDCRRASNRAFILSQQPQASCQPRNFLLIAANADSKIAVIGSCGALKCLNICFICMNALRDIGEIDRQNIVEFVGQ